MNATTIKKRPGHLVMTKSGKGRTYHNEDPVKGKVRVYLLDNNFQVTGEKLLCDPKSLQIKGHFD